jgi:RNA polymerase sigma-70 factor (ECF subfamily)
LRKELGRNSAAARLADGPGEDEQLLERFTSGGGEAEHKRYFEQFIWPQMEAAYRFARWMVRDHHDAEDVVQESFVKAYRAAGTFRGGDVRPWLFAIVRNSAMNYLQRKRSGSQGEAPDVADPAPDPETALARKNEQQRVQAAIRELPAEFRETLLLREMEGMAYKEIAAVLNTPMGTVMSRLSRARQMLMEKLKPEMEACE